MRWRKAKRKIAKMIESAHGGHITPRDVDDSFEPDLTDVWGALNTLDERVHTDVASYSVKMGKLDSDVGRHASMLEDFNKRLASLGKDVYDNIERLDQHVHDLRDAMTTRWSGSKNVVTRKRAPKNPPKFCNPENPKQTWSGRGAPPAWMRRARESGMPDEELLINSGNSEG